MKKKKNELAVVPETPGTPGTPVEMITRAITNGADLEKMGKLL